MTTEPHGDLDRQLRDAFAPEPAAVARVADRALEEAPRRRASWPAIVGIGVTAAVALLAGVLAIRVSRPAGPEPAGADSPAAVEALDTRPGPALSGFFTGGALVVPVSDTDIVIIGAGERGERPPDGFGIVLVEGELR